MSIYRGSCSSTIIGAALICSAAQCLAQTAGEARPSDAQAGAPTAQSDNSAAAVLEPIVVTAKRSIAGGLMKVQSAAETMSSVTPEAIQEKLSVASPLQLASTLPGVNFGDSDAYGLSVRNFVSVRGLDQTELGWMVAGVPGVDLYSYYPYSEAWADNENISDITLTPGNSRLEDPIISASGGEFIESIRDPRDSFGGMLSASYGSYDGWRAFGDIDTGSIAQTGAKAFLSYSYTSAHNYVGPGTNTRDHVDFKVDEDWSPTIHSSLFVSYNYWVNARIPFLTLAQADKGLTTNDFEQFAYAATFTPGVVTPNYYKDVVATRENALVASNNDIVLSDKVTLHIAPYFHYTNSDVPGEAALSPSSTYSGDALVTPAYSAASLQNGKLLVQNNNWFSESQVGVNADIEADITSTNHCIVGYWHEYWKVADASYYDLMYQDGSTVGTSQAAALRTTAGGLISNTDFLGHTNTDQVVVGDTQSMLDDKLKLSVGFKYLLYSVGGVNYLTGAPPTFSANWSEPLPRLLVSYDVNPDTQLYANITTNARMPVVPSTYLTDFSTTTGAISQAANPAQKPEYSIGEQIGYRYHGPLNVDANAFYMTLLHHQLSSLQDINGTLVPTAFSVGSETIRGASIEVSTRSYAGFSIYGNTQYLRGTFDDNTPVDGTYLPTRGKQMVESPNWIASLGGRYDHGPLFAEVIAKYVSDQYTTFMNDQTMPSYETVDLTLGYRLPDYDGLKNSIIRLNITNLRDKSYISSDATVVTNAVATRGINGAIVPAGTPYYYIGAPLAAMVTLSTSF